MASQAYRLHCDVLPDAASYIGVLLQPAVQLCPGIEFYVQRRADHLLGIIENGAAGNQLA